MIRWTGLAPWEFEFPFPSSLTSTFLYAGFGAGSGDIRARVWQQRRHFARPKQRHVARTEQRLPQSRHGAPRFPKPFSVGGFGLRVQGLKARKGTILTLVKDPRFYHCVACRLPHTVAPCGMYSTFLCLRLHQLLYD